MNRRRLFLLIAVSALLGAATGAVADDFILHPAYIEGTVSISDGLGGEYTLTDISASANGWDPVGGNSYQANTNVTGTNQFSLTVEAGDWPYGISVRASYAVDGTTGQYVRWRDVTSVVEGETVNLAFETDSIIEGTVAVAGESVRYIDTSVSSTATDPEDPQYGFISTRFFHSDAFRVPVLGGDTPYRLRISGVQMVSDQNDYLTLPKEDVVVAPGESATVDISVVPGYIEGAVTITGASITSYSPVGARGTDPATGQYVYASTRLSPDGTYRFPVLPGTDVMVYGTARTDAGSHQLIAKYVDVYAGETTSCNWTIDLSAGLSGEIAVTGMNLDRIQIYGFGPNGSSRSATILSPGSFMEYEFDGVTAGQWGVRLVYWDYEEDAAVGIEDEAYYFSPEQYVDIVAGSHTTGVDFSLDAGFLGGAILGPGSAAVELLSYSWVRARPSAASVYESAFSWERDTDLTDEYGINTYSLFMNAPSEWRIDVVSLEFEDWSAGYAENAQLNLSEWNPQTQDYLRPLVPIAPGLTSTYDLGYQLARVTSRLGIATNEPFASPRVSGRYQRNLDGELDRSGSYSYGQTEQSSVEEALVSVYLVPGTWRLGADAYVGDSWSTFGEPYEVTVQAGDVVDTDLDAPTLIVEHPPGLQELTETCVVVSGTVTDDSGVASLTINGENVPVDSNDAFSHEVCGLVPGENVIEVTACDNPGNCVTVGRTVILVNTPPVADAGDNLVIISAEQSITVIEGLALDADGDEMTYRWVEYWQDETGEVHETVLLDWTPVALGDAGLDLGLLSSLLVGNYTLTLEVTDGHVTVSDEMILTIENSPPEIAPAPSRQEVEIGVDGIVVGADVADFDGDDLWCEWAMGGETLAAESVQTQWEGYPVPMTDLFVAPGDPRFTVGEHTITLTADDGVNAPVSDEVIVEVVDTTAPTLIPGASETLLWPPNHQLHAITLVANAGDNGGPVTLSVEVISSEPEDGDGDGNTIPDIYIDSVNDQTGEIQLRLRAERAGKGDGRTYTVLITATDASGNASTAIVEIRAPHDRRRG